MEEQSYWMCATRYIIMLIMLKSSSRCMIGGKYTNKLKEKVEISKVYTDIINWTLTKEQRNTEAKTF